MNVLEIVQQACYSAGVTPPSSLISQTDAQVLQYINQFYAECRSLRARRWWPQLKRKAFVVLVDGQQTYQLPRDFFASIPNTQWDIDNKWAMEGPMNDNIWNYRTYGYVTTENRKMWRIWGPDMNPNDAGFSGQFFVGPTPGGDPTTAGQPLTFEYITKSTFMPPNWAPSTGYTATTSYVNASGWMYQAANSSTSGTTPPNSFRAVSGRATSYGYDGGVMWRFVPTPAWQATTPYGLYDYVSSGGSFYRCTGAGISGVVGPSASDGTVTWELLTTPAWVAETIYAANAYVTTTAGAQLYIATPQYIQGSVTTRSGKVAPSWGTTTVLDGTQSWTMIADPYETILSNSDLCLFDDDVVISGLTWRYMRAKGAKYEDLLAEYNTKVDEAVNRWNSSVRISLADDTTALAGLRPNVPEGNFGF